MNRSEVTKILAVLSATYTNHKIGEYAESVWYMTFKDTPYEVARTAALEWMANEEWFPTPAGLKRYFPAAPGLPSTDDAWRMVEERIKNTYPGMPSPTWDVPRVVSLAVGDVGGLREIRMSEKPDQMRDRFRRAYEQRTKQEQPSWTTSEPSLPDSSRTANDAPSLPRNATKS